MHAIFPSISVSRFYFWTEIANDFDLTLTLHPLVAKHTLMTKHALILWNLKSQQQVFFVCCLQKVHQLMSLFSILLKKFDLNLVFTTCNDTLNSKLDFFLWCVSQDNADEKGRTKLDFLWEK